MSDGMTIDRRAVVQAAIIEGVFCVVGVLAGVVWQWLWTPAMGGVLDHKWAPADAIALSQQFSGTGWYVVVGSVAGLVTGALVALFLDRAPLLTLANRNDRLRPRGNRLLQSWGCPAWPARAPRTRPPHPRLGPT